MWQRFSERARKSVFYAQEEAQRFGEGYVSTEHLLLGLLREPDNTACHVLQKLGHKVEDVREAVEKQLPSGGARPNQDMSLTPRAKRVIDLAYEEARRIGNDYIGCEHLLLGLIGEHDGLAGRVMTHFGITLDQARDQVIQEQDLRGTVTRHHGSASESAASYVRPPQPPITKDWSKFPLISELFFALLNESDEAIEQRLEALKHDRKELKAEIANLLLNQ